MTIQDPTQLQVGDWQISPDEGAISRGTDRRHLEPLAMQVLVYLASKPGQVVSRAELEEQVWHGTLVGYDAVTSTVIKLRKALDDDARAPAYIATVPKRGYQLIARVARVEPDQRVDATPSPASKPVRDRADRTKVALLVAVLAAVALLVWLIIARLVPPSEHAATAPVVSDPPSIVVLPFENLSDDPAQERFADGMTEDLITDLSGIAGVRVIASNTSFSYKGQRVAPQQVRADLRVDYILDGSVRRRGDELRVNAHLVDAATAFQVWARRYDRPTQETFHVQDELTRHIVETLAVQISPQEQQRLARQPTNNLAAYDHFQEGQRLSKINTPETNLEAQAAYRRAIETDPSYGRAYGALAYTMAYNYRRGWSDAPVQTIDRALELARKGVQLDSSIPQTFWSLSYVHLMRKSFEQAEKTVQKALEIAPNYADGYGLLALIKNGLGDAPAAIANIRKGMQLNPYYTWDYPYNLGRAYYILGDYPKAIEYLEAAKARNPNVMPIRLTLAAAYVGADRLGDAEWEVEEMQSISPGETLSQIAKTHPASDQHQLRRLLDDLRAAGLPE